MPSTGIDRIDGNTTSVAVKAPCTICVNNQSARTVLSGIQTLQGVTLQAGNGTMLPDRVLVNDQVDQTLNGIYIVQSQAWIRAYDFNGARDAVRGTLVNIDAGDYANTQWALTTLDNPIEFGISDIVFGLVATSSVLANAVDYVQLVYSVATSPVAHVGLTAAGQDSKIGFNFNSKGTTTAGNQYNGNVVCISGDYNFYIAGRRAVRMVDTYWNPNDIYPGQPNGWVVLSSGWGDPTNSTDMISGVISVEATGYPGTPSGASLLIGSKGPSGEIHFIGNGGLGHVTIDAPVNSNPIGADIYATYVNGIRFAGAFGASGIGPQIKVNPSGHASDTSIPLTFYNFANGGYIFMSGNGSTHSLSINHVTNGVNYVNVTPGASGNNAIIWAAGSSGGQRLTLAGSDLGGVDICNGGQYNGTSSCAPLAKFFGDFATPNFFSFTCSSVSRYPTLAPDGSDTDIDLLIKGKGAGLLRVGTYTGTGISNTGYITIKDAGGTSRRLMVG